MDLVQTRERPLADLGETFLERGACVIRHGGNLPAMREARKLAGIIAAALSREQGR